MGPIDYTMDVKTPVQQSMAGFTQGFDMRKEINATQDAERQRAQALQLQTDLGTLAKNPNAGAHDYAKMMTLYPQLSEHFKRGWDVLNGEQQQTKLSDATQVYAAVHAGKPEIASQLLTDKATALRNSGKEDEAKAAETMAKFITMDPNSAKTTTGLMLSSLMGPDKFAETFAKLGKESRDVAEAPADLAKKTADADKAKSDAELARIKAVYGERSEVADLASKGWNVQKIIADIAHGKEQNRIAAMQASIARETNGLKRTEMQLAINKHLTEQAEHIQGRAAEVFSARGNIDNMLNTVDQLLQHPGLTGATGSVAARLPSFRQDSADFDALMQNANAQAFLSQIPQMKGTGALSDAEGAKLAASLQSFDQKQSGDQLKKNMLEAQRLLLKGRKALTLKYGVPETVPDTPAARPSAKDVADLLKKYGAQEAPLK